MSAGQTTFVRGCSSNEGAAGKRVTPVEVGGAKTPVQPALSLCFFSHFPSDVRKQQVNMDEKISTKSLKYSAFSFCLFGK